MPQVRVKITESFAVLGDPRPTEELDKKYNKVKESMMAREKPPSPATINETIKLLKQRDRYGEKAYGFRRDRGFKPGDELMLDESLAKKWEADEKCIILEETKPTKAA